MRLDNFAKAAVGWAPIGCVEQAPLASGAQRRVYERVVAGTALWSLDLAIPNPLPRQDIDHNGFTA